MLPTVLASIVLITALSGCMLRSRPPMQPPVYEGRAPLPATFDELLPVQPPLRYDGEQRRSTAAYYFLVAEYISQKSHISEARELYDLAASLDANEVTAAKRLSAATDADSNIDYFQIRPRNEFFEVDRDSGELKIKSR